LYSGLDQDSLRTHIQDWLRTHSGLTFRTGSGLIFRTGSGLTQDSYSGLDQDSLRTHIQNWLRTGSELTQDWIRTHSGLIFRTGSGLILRTGSGLILRTGSGLILRTGIMEQVWDGCRFWKECRKRVEADWNTLEELQSGREANRTWLQLMHCTLVHTVSYFGKPIGQKRKQGEPKSIFRLEIQEETSEYIY